MACIPIWVVHSCSKAKNKISSLMVFIKKLNHSRKRLAANCGCHCSWWRRHCYGWNKDTWVIFVSFSSDFLIFYSLQATLCHYEYDCLHYRNPNSKDGGVEWPRFDPRIRQFLEMRSPVRPGTDIFFKHFKMWLEKLSALMVWWFRLWCHQNRRQKVFYRGALHLWGRAWHSKNWQYNTDL